jgi:hypothetical protein
MFIPIVENLAVCGLLKTNLYPYACRLGTLRRINCVIPPVKLRNYHSNITVCFFYFYMQLVKYQYFSTTFGILTTIKI